MKKIFDNEFDNILLEADCKYQYKKRKYNTSWKNMSINELHNRLLNELDEFNNSKSNHEKYMESIDIINISLMLSKRIKQNIIKNIH